MLDASTCFSGVCIIVGHYGVGKTNLALNIAMDCLAAGIDVSLADLDIVNPYFRSSEHADLIESHGGKMVSPVLAHTSVDVPSLSAAVMGSIEHAQADPKALCLLDVGGDDAGATALGRFSDAILRCDYQMLYVVNSRRNLTQGSHEAIGIMRQIEAASGLRVSGIIGNDHLKGETDLACIEAGYRFACECAALADVPMAFSTIPDWLIKRYASENRMGISEANLYPVRQIVKTIWE